MIRRGRELVRCERLNYKGLCRVIINCYYVHPRNFMKLRSEAIYAFTYI